MISDNAGWVAFTPRALGSFSHSRSGRGNESKSIAEASVRVMVVDSNEVTLTGMARVLSRASDLEIVATTTSGEDALDLMGRTEPEVVFIADRLLPMSGAQTCAAITDRDPRIAVVVLSIEPTSEAIAAYLIAGARGFLTRGAKLTDLTNAARIAKRGGCVLSPTVADRVVKWAARGSSDLEGRASLSSIDVEILTLIGRGLSNAAIARHVGFSLGAVKAHVAQILRTLGATRRTDAVAIAIRRGIVAPRQGESEVGNASERDPETSHRLQPPEGVDDLSESGSASISVVIVDDREVTREGLLAVLTRGGSVAASSRAGTVLDASTLIDEVDPDIIVASLGHGALELCRGVSDTRLRAHILVLGGPNPAREQIREVLMSGARACLVGDPSADGLALAVRAIVIEQPSSGSRLLGCADLSELESSGLEDSRIPAPSIEPDEARVLRLVCEGMTNVEIAGAVGRPVDWVKRCIKDVYVKLGVSSRAEAAAVALRDRVI